MIAFQVGKPFPQPLPPHGILSARPFGGGVLLLLKADSSYTAAQLADLDTALTVTLGDARWPVLLFEHEGGTGGTVGLNLLDQMPQQQAAFLAAQGALQVTYVQIGADNVVRRIHVFTLPTEMSRLVRRAVEDAVHPEWTADRLHARLEAAMNLPRPTTPAATFTTGTRHTSAETDAPDAVRRVAEHALGAFGVWPVPPYPGEALPPALALWHVYTTDGGHSILCVRAEDAEQANGSIPEDYLLPAPVRTVQRCGYEAVEMGLPAPVVVVAGLDYDPDLGLAGPPGDDEY